MSAILDYFIKQQRELRKVNDDLFLKIVRAFQTLFRQAQPRIDNIRLTLEANPKITQAQIKKTAAYVELIDEVGREIDDLATYSRIELEAASIDAVVLAVAHLRDFYSLNGIQAQIIPPDAIQLLINYLAPDGELVKRISLWAPNAVEQVSKSIIDGVGLGRNPRKIAADIGRAFGVGLTDALRTTRTVQLWAYREATRLNYIANSDIVGGWIWLAVLDDRTCMSCLAMHGTTHRLDEILNDHHNGRCAMLPLIDGVDYGLTDAQAWFDVLSEAQKVQQMGAGKYKAYTDGLFTFDQLSKIYNDPVYGDMRTEAALKDLLNV